MKNNSNEERSSSEAKVSFTSNKSGQAKRQAILVLGMHRSGTSALTGLLSLLGARPPKSLMSGDDWNPRGYWESTKIMNFHDRLLASAGTVWSDWGPFSQPWHVSLEAEAYREEFPDLLAREFGDARLFVVKDPRICRISPFWLRALEDLDIEPKVILPIRNPLEVAQSLSQRNGISTTEGLLLWLRHCLDAEVASRAVPRCFLRHEDLLGDWRGAVEKISRNLDIALPRWSAKTQLSADDFVTDSLRHNVFSRNELDVRRDVFEWVRGAYAAFEKLVESEGADVDALEQLDEIRREFDQSSSIFATIVFRQRVISSTLTARATELERHAEERAAQIAVLEGELSAMQTQVSEHQSALLRSETALAEMTAQHEAETTRLNAAIVAERSARQTQASEHQSVLLRSETALAEMTAQHEAETTRLNAAVVAELSARQTQASEHQSARLRSETALAEMRSQLNAETTRLNARATELGRHAEERATQLTVVERELSAKQAQASELQDALLRSDIVLAEMTSQLEAETIRLNAAVVAERSARESAEALAAQLAESYQEFDIPIVRLFAGATRTLRRLKEFGMSDRLLPGRRRQRRRKKRLDVLAQLVADSGYFDREWYLEQYPDVANAGDDPILHYFACGADEGRLPNFYFDGDWYLRTYPDVAETGMNPLVHFIKFGEAENRSPGPAFSTLWYLENNPDVVLAGENAFSHFLVHGLAEGRQPAPIEWGYEQWQAKFDYRPDRDREGYVAALAEVSLHPRISILMPVHNPNPSDLEAAIQSVVNQIYPNWELCIADDASTDESVRSVLEAASKLDSRIKVVYRERNGHISEATNSAFALVNGEYVGLLDHDDVLREHALAEVVIAINDHPDVELLYSDEDKLSTFGERYDAFFKPDFSPDLFYAMNYINHFTVHRTENVQKVGGWRKGYEGSQDYDINLRIIETIDPRRIVHIPKILYHWKAVEGSTAQAGSEKNYAYDAGFRALEDHVARRRLPAKVENIEGLPFYRFRWDVPHPEPLVSLIIPTRDMVDVLRTCINSIIEKTTYSNYEILIVDNDSREKATLEYFAEVIADPRIRILSYAKPFNYSAINNFAAQQAKGTILGLINNDIEVIAPEWLDEMTSHALRPEIGCVGAKLLYPDDTIQHAGVILGVGGVAGHGHCRFGRTKPGYFSRLQVVQNYSAVTAACLLVRAEIFWQVGGLDEENLTVAFNDVDFCLKVREAGYRNLFTPFSLLYHHESLSRGHEDTPEKMLRFAGEVKVMKERWGDQLLRDPFYSPNLTLDRTDFSSRAD